MSVNHIKTWIDSGSKEEKMDRYEAITTMANARLILDPVCITGRFIVSTKGIIAFGLLSAINRRPI